MAQPAEKRESNKATAIKDAAFNWETRSTSRAN